MTPKTSQGRKAARTPKSVRLDAEGLKALRMLVQRSGGASENEVIQHAIIETAERQALRDDALAAFDDAAKRWADVLERLA
jgi:hypothetical protein